MPVRRQKDRNYSAPQQEVAAAIRAVLSGRPPYFTTKEIDGDTIFSTSIKPSFWLLPTAMSAELKSHSSGTKVVAKTISQWFILGDVFNYYNRYLRDFLEAVEEELKTPKE